MGRSGKDCCISSVIRWSFFFLPKQSLKSEPSYKIDLDFWDCLEGMVKKSYYAELHKIDLVICSHSREGKTPSYSQINMVSLPVHFIPYVTLCFLHYKNCMMSDICCNSILYCKR